MKLFLFLLFWSLTSFPPPGGGPFASAQLYSDFLENAKLHNLPLAFTDSLDYLEAAKKSEPKEKEAIKTLTCIAKIPVGWKDIFPVLAETRDHFRSRNLYSNYNPHYFCSNVPKFNRRFGAPSATVGEGHATPHSKFWLREPTAWHWSHRVDSHGEDKATGKILMDAKNMGFIFTVQVTGIQSGGRFLKGWFHLRIRLDIDHNIKDPASKGNDPSPIEDLQKRRTQADIYLQDYVIDKLIVTARGRTLVPGKNQKKTDEVRPPRRAWVGGIGEFVRDFPPCSESGYNPQEPYVPQQFMPCGAVQYSESQFGNNFYYSRGVGGGATKYGRGQGEAVQEIHLNFRLDNSFCNRYYDLDFIANGMVMRKDVKIDLEGFNSLASPYSRPSGELSPIYIIQRSISTRFAFVSSHKDHGPSYWENADPVPRGVDSVNCSAPLQGLHLMGDAPSVPSFNSAVKPGKEMKAEDLPPKEDSHNTSVTQGAHLIPNPSVDASSSFGGSIKFIYPLPISSSLLSGSSSGFSLRRTWSYPDTFILPEEVFATHASFWNAWTDWKEFRNAVGTKSFSSTSTPRAAILTAVQRVLHEFDWESWRERSRTLSARRHGNAPDVSRAYSWQWTAFPDFSVNTAPPGCRGKASGLPAYSEGNCQSWCDVHLGAVDVWNSQAEWWPHPYYDATCVGVDIFNTDKDGEFHAVRDLVKSHELGKLDSRVPTAFEAEYPPILGRCRPSLFFNTGIGSIHTAPPTCNEFFDEHNKKRIVDPALAMVIRATNGSGRITWNDKYGPEATEKREKYQAAICGVVNKLKKEFPYCPSIPAQPFTPTPSPILVARKEKDFKMTLAYNRGMMVAENPYSLYVYDSRVLHGLVMTIIVMFITPISIFLVRYFKETFMDSRVFLHKIWFFVHVGAAFLIPLLFLVAMWRLVGARAILGVSLSKTGKSHRVFGWAAILIAILLASLGGFRCMNRILRGIIIFLHFILGFAFYFISLGLIMVSVAIPGSPSASYYDFSIIGTINHGEKRGAELRYLGREPIFLILTGWILFDLVMNILMTVMQCCNDYKMELTEPRTCLGAGIPVLSENFRFDTPGRFFRIWALRLYVCVALGVTISICVLIRLNSPRARGFGFMSCTHTPSLDVAITYLEPCLRVDTTDEAINAAEA